MIGMSFKNFADLKKAILEKAKKGMEEKVLDSVKVFMHKSIREVVYSWGEPQQYVRRHNRGGGGLDDVDQNVKGYFDSTSKDGFSYRIENETLPDTVGYSPTDYLTPLIVMGQLKAQAVGYPVLYHDFAELEPYGQPRDFIGKTKEYLKQYDVVKIQLEDYMNDK